MNNISPNIKDPISYEENLSLQSISIIIQYSFR